MEQALRELNTRRLRTLAIYFQFDAQKLIAQFYFMEHLPRRLVVLNPGLGDNDAWKDTLLRFRVRENRSEAKSVEEVHQIFLRLYCDVYFCFRDQRIVSYPSETWRSSIAGPLVVIYRLPVHVVLVLTSRQGVHLFNCHSAHIRQVVRLVQCIVVG